MVSRVDNVTNRSGEYKVGDYIVIPDQPYFAFAMALLEPQKYPDLRDKGGRPIPPYDVTAHTLPLLMGLDVFHVPSLSPGLRLTRLTQTPVIMTAYPPLVDREGRLNDQGQLMLTRMGLYKSHVSAIDEGWTRWLLERRAAVGLKSIHDSDVRAGNLQETFDAIIIPDQGRAAILNGHRKGAMPDEYTGGLGEQGVNALREFVEAGGTLVCLNRASDFAIEQFKLPVKDIVDVLPRTDFYVPGSILRIELDANDPITKGMPKESIAWVENSPVFEVPGSADASSASSAKGEQAAGEGARDPNHGPMLPVRVIAWYPKDKDPLLSGWLLGRERIKGKAALVEVGMGKGRIILFGFRPQYRGQSLATYPLFFNAIMRR